jgi:ParB-like chromosome segregation protein Spo0J
MSEIVDGERVAVIEVRRMTLTEIKPHPRNPRKHPEENSAAWEVLKKSLERDYFDPLVVNRRNGMLVSGHLRHKILLASGFTHADVSVVDYDEATHLARLVAANKLIGEFDDATLTALAGELEAASLSAALAGWSAADLAALLPSTADGEEKPLRDLKEKFGVAPFSILRVFQWLGRKKLWNTLIIVNRRLGFGDNNGSFLFGDNQRGLRWLRNKRCIWLGIVIGFRGDILPHGN